MLMLWRSLILSLKLITTPLPTFKRKFKAVNCQQFLVMHPSLSTMERLALRAHLHFITWSSTPVWTAALQTNTTLKQINVSLSQTIIPTYQTTIGSLMMLQELIDLLTSHFPERILISLSHVLRVNSSSIIKHTIASPAQKANNLTMTPLLALLVLQASKWIPTLMCAPLRWLKGYSKRTWIVQTWFTTEFPQDSFNKTTIITSPSIQI